MTLVSASILSDVFTIEWGLRKLVFRECDLDEYVRMVEQACVNLANLIKPDAEADIARSTDPWHSFVFVGSFK